ncbi:MAG: hypothetical protein K0Q55_604 [Verrucomicrobia bacterium]|jgi:hypothetical protein|nr:hypothetical protein [Verrucomicrobiota bacterium]
MELQPILAVGLRSVEVILLMAFIAVVFHVMGRWHPVEMPRERIRFLKGCAATALVTPLIFFSPIYPDITDAFLTVTMTLAMVVSNTITITYGSYRWGQLRAWRELLKSVPISVPEPH